MTIPSRELVIAPDSFNPSLFCFLMCNHCFLIQPVRSSQTVYAEGSQQTLDCFFFGHVWYSFGTWLSLFDCLLPPELHSCFRVESTTHSDSMGPCLIHRILTLEIPKHIASQQPRVSPAYTRASAGSSHVVTSSQFGVPIASQSQVVADAINFFIISSILFIHCPSACLNVGNSVIFLTDGGENEKIGCYCFTICKRKAHLFFFFFFYGRSAPEKCSNFFVSF